MQELFSMMKCIQWLPVEREGIPVCENILFTDGRRVFSGWLETYEPNEDPLFFVTIGDFGSWPEGITHWMPLPKPPTSEECLTDAYLLDDSR